jgi:hypothetical protein
MTNLSMKWLAAELKSGRRPRADAAELHEYLTDFNSLRIFSSRVFEDGEIAIYDLDYDPETLVETGIDFLFLPPNRLGGYMIRATVAKKELAALTMESVYVVACVAVPSGILEEKIVCVLEEAPLYSRELFR